MNILYIKYQLLRIYLLNNFFKNLSSFNEYTKFVLFDIRHVHKYLIKTILSISYQNYTQCKFSIK